MPDKDKIRKQNKISEFVAPNITPLRNSISDLINPDEETLRRYNPDNAVRNWHINYINSPKYRERLQKSGYSNMDQVINDRSNRVRNTTILRQSPYLEDVGSYYMSGANQIFIDNNQVRDLRTTRDDILAHEFSHVSNANIGYITNEMDPNKGLIMSPGSLRMSNYEEDYIASRNKRVNPGLLLKSKRIASEEGEILGHVLDRLDHDYSPSENKSDIDAFRFILSREGIYDAGKQDFTPELLKKAKDNNNIKKTFNVKRLFKNFSDENLIDIMNNIAINNNNQDIPLAQNGISVTNDGKKKLTAAQIRQKYNNPYVTAGREQWGEYLDTKMLPFVGKPVKEVVYEASRTTGLPPELLYTSAMEEGLREGIDEPGVTSEAYDVAIGRIPNPKTKKKQQASFSPNEFPIDGFRTYGLDTFGDQFESLKRKGYLPKGFEERFTRFKAINELDQEVNTAAFRTEQDALTAKAAILRNTRENLNNFLKNKNITLTPRQQDFFNLVGYNAGEGNMRKMIESYRQKGYLKNDEFLTDPDFKPASYAQPYTYAQRRLVNAEVLENEGFFGDYNTTQSTTTNSTSMNNGGYISFNPEIYNNLYPDGQFTDLRMKMKLGGQVKKRKNPFEPYFATADFGPEPDPFAVMAKDGIHIKKENRGKFTASAKRAGMGVQEFARHVLANPEDYSPTQRKRANFARNASKWKKGQSGIEVPYLPNTVSTPEDPIFYQDPLDEARANISNFFRDNSNQVINDASLNADPRYQQNIDPSFSQQGTDMTDQAVDNADGTNPGLATAQRIMGAIPDINTGMFIQGTAAIANLATRGKREAQEYARLVRNYSQQGVYNPRRYGTGSQAIFNDGGKVKAISTNQFGSPTLQFNGASHEDGGIPIVYADQGVEVEGGETAFVDGQNNLNVFGNMYVPGTNNKFKTVSKRIAKLENKHQNDLDTGVELVNTNDPISKYGKFSFNAGKVMMTSNAKSLQELEDTKSSLADLQNQMLNEGFDEESSKQLKMKFGGKVKYNPTSYNNGGRKKGNKRNTPPTYNERVQLTGPGNFKIPVPEIPSFTRTATIGDLDIPVTMQPSRNPITNTQDQNPNTTTTSTRTRGNNSLFPQILPEIMTIATERPEFVPGQTYNPNLLQPYQVSFQDQLNENNASFRAIAQQVGNNPEALSQLAAQKYQADQSILANEFRTNQAIENQIVNQNINLLNQSQLQNIQLADTQFVRQAQARSNTRENIRNAITSISSKAAQKRLEDMTYNVYANMFPHYDYDDEGNLIYQRGQDPVFTSGIQDTGSNDYTTTKVTRDARGNVRTTSTTPSKAQQERIDLQNDKARKSRLTLMQKLFGK